MAAEPDLTVRALPWLADYIAENGITARALADAGQLGSLIRRRWPDAEPSVAATLWWYSASSTFMLVPAAQMLVSGDSMNMSPDALTVHQGDDGLPDALRSSSRLESPTELGGALHELCEVMISGLVEAGGVHAPSLWAIASDSLANRTLDVGTELGRIADATSLARTLASGMPTPRFVDIDAAGSLSAADENEPEHGRRRFLQRSSCCLLFEVGAHKCSSCPRQLPATRIARLASLVG